MRTIGRAGSNVAFFCSAIKFLSDFAINLEVDWVFCDHYLNVVRNHRNLALYANYMLCICLPYALCVSSVCQQYVKRMLCMRQVCVNCMRNITL